MDLYEFIEKVVQTNLSLLDGVFETSYSIESLKITYNTDCNYLVLNVFTENDFFIAAKIVLTEKELIGADVLKVSYIVSGEESTFSCHNPYIECARELLNLYLKIFPDAEKGHFVDFGQSTVSTLDSTPELRLLQIIIKYGSKDAINFAKSVKFVASKY
jgi:hypothetical protein